MSLTRAELELVLPEIAAARGGKIQRAFERDRRCFVLQIRVPGQTMFVAIDTTPGWSGAYLVDEKPTQPPRPSSFVMLLRSRVVDSRLRSATLAPDDRLLTLRFERPDGEEALTLVAELTGRHGNAFLLDGGGRIVSSLRPAADARELAPGGEWTAPPPPNALDDSVRWNLDAAAIGERSAIVAREFGAARSEQEVDQLRQQLTAQLRAANKRLRRLLRNVEDDLQRAAEAELSKRRAELLQSAYGRPLARGATSVRVPDYYEEGTPQVEVPLDPKLDLQQNIARLFKEYRRLHEAQETIEERNLEVMALLEACEAARGELSEVPDDALEEFSTRLKAEGILRPPRRGTRQTATRLPYRRFTTLGGASVLVGRGAKGNDELTSRHARGRDVWLHARDWAGAHVVLRMSGDGEPDGQDLLDAALLAAHFSKGKRDSLVDVTWTRAKHVRKPKGGAPGLVTIAGGSTITVAPDDERLTKLLSREET